MASQARRLRRLIYRANLDLDARYAPLAKEVEALILRHSPGGKVTPMTKAIVMVMVERMLALAEPGIARGIVARSGEAERLAEEGFGE